MILGERAWRFGQKSAVTVYRLVSLFNAKLFLLYAKSAIAHP